MDAASVQLQQLAKMKFKLQCVVFAQMVIIAVVLGHQSILAKIVVTSACLLVIFLILSKQR